MATLTQKQSSFLKMALRGNGIFSAVSGLLIVTGAGTLISLMGAGNSLFYLVIGIGLMLHALILFLNARNENIHPGFAWYAIIGDVAWILATVAILLTDTFSLSTEGKWLLLIIGDIVLVFAIAQYIGLRRMNRA